MKRIDSRERQRGPRTTTRQYQIYLEFLEECEPLRTNILDKTMPPNYIKTKWEEMTKFLNLCPDGPILSASEWQTRFGNWKNSTRVKKRALDNEKLMNLGGPTTTKPLTPLEETGLNLWGRASIGAPTENIKVYADTNEDISQEMIKIKELPFAFDLNENGHEEIITSPSTSRDGNNCKTFIHSFTSNPQKRKLPATKEDKEYDNFLIEKVRLKFEIAKYTFENPGFFFDASELD